MQKYRIFLQEHVRIHTGDKPFECKHCGKRFSHSGSYSSHMTSKKCHLKSASSKSASSDSPATPAAATNGANSGTATPTPAPSEAGGEEEAKVNLSNGLAAEALAAAAVARLSSPMQLSITPSVTSATAAAMSPTSSVASTSSTSAAPIKLPTEPVLPAALNPLLLNPLALPSTLQQQQQQQPSTDAAVLQSLRTLLPDLSAVFSAPSSLNHQQQVLPKPNIADTLSALFGADELASFRRVLETINASVTRTLLEENLRRWSQEVLAGSILEQLATARPVPVPVPVPMPMVNPSPAPASSSGCADSEGVPTDDDEEDEEEEEEEEEEMEVDTNSSKRSLSSVRSRTLISEDQSTVLRHFYSANPKPRREELQRLADAVGHSFKVVKVWFQNTRARDRREGRKNGRIVKPESIGDLAFKALGSLTPTTVPPSLSSLTPLPASMVFSKFPSASPTLPPPPPPPPASITPPAVVCMPPATKAALAAALDLTTTNKSDRSVPTPSATPPPLVINSDAEEDDDEQSEEEAEAPEDVRPMDTVKEEEEEEEEIDDEEPLDDEDEKPSSAQLDFEKMIHDKLTSLSPSAAAILPSTPLPKDRAKEALAAAVKGATTAEGDGSNSSSIVAVGGIYACDQCDKTFTKKSSITRHKYEHSGWLWQKNHLQGKVKNNFIHFLCSRPKASQVHRLRQGVQAQAPPYGAQAAALRGEALPVPKVPEAVLPLRLLQPAHQPQVLLLQALQGMRRALKKPHPHPLEAD